MYVSCTIADLINSKESSEFDAWLHVASVGNKIILDLPIKKHKHFNKYESLGKRLNSYIITDKYIQFSFEIETGPKKEGNKLLGIDTGINALASLSNRLQLGLDIKVCIERIKRCKQGSKGQKVARRALKQRIDEVVQAIITLDPDLIVVEKLKDLNKNTKLKRLCFHLSLTAIIISTASLAATFFNLAESQVSGKLTMSFKSLDLEGVSLCQK